MKLVLPLLFLVRFLPAQIPVADQTFKVSDTQEYLYALAAGDKVDLHVQLLVGRRLKVVELVQYPEYPLYRSYDLDTVLDKSILIPQTGIYILRIHEAGLGKKVCRFTLHRTPAGPETARLDTRITWDLRVQPQYQISRRPVPAGTKTEIIPISGQAVVGASKMGLKKPVGAYQFTLPPNTVRWAYRLSVGQASTEARRKDAGKLSDLLRSTSTKVAAYQPQTALAAFALGMAIDLTTSTSGEDVEYALVDSDNLQKFFAGENTYQAHIWQSGVSVDVQRRYVPLTGTWFFALRSNNWVDDIDVFVDIEAVTETPLFDMETYLEAAK